MFRPGSVLHRVALLALLSVVGGLLVAGIALPVIGGLGIGAKAASNALSKLPSFLDNPPLAQHSVLRASDGSVIATLSGAEDRVVVPLTDIPGDMQAAIIAIEDSRFYEHHGVDIRSVLRALRANSNSGDFSQGASTITQQYVKNVLIENAGSKEARKAATEKSISRKLREARLAIALERRLTKSQILEGYLNIAYFGEGVYGVGTAAEHYFGIPARQLTLAQAALLAGLVNDPADFDPVAHPAASRARRDTVLHRIDQLHYWRHDQVLAAFKTPVVVHPTKLFLDPCQESRVPFFCTYVRATLLDDPALGATRLERANALFEGGLNIYTTLDPRVQRAVDKGIAAMFRDDIRQSANVIVMQPGTGQVLALGENRKYGPSKTPGQSTDVFAAGDHHFGHYEQPGSTFKAITLTAAIEAGVPLQTTFFAPACYYSPIYTGFGSRKSGGRCPGGFANAGDSESGNFNLATGTWYSVNTFFIQLEQRVGLSRVAAMAQRLGVTAPELDNPSRYGGALTIGGVDVSEFDMATVYTTLAAHGRACPPSVVTRITTLKGEPVSFTPPAACQQVVSPGVADTVTSILQGVLTQPGATGGAAAIGRPAAGKTGTVDSYPGAWFIGYVPQFTMAIALFDPKAPSERVSPVCTVAGRCYYDQIYGGDLPAQLWHNIMSVIVDGVPVQQFAIPPLSYTTNKDQTVPDVAGLSVADATQLLRTAGFLVDVAHGRVESSEKNGRVASTDPPGGSKAKAGSLVTIFVSNGHAPPSPSPTSSPEPTTPVPTTPVETTSSTESPSPSDTPTPSETGPQPGSA